MQCRAIHQPNNWMSRNCSQINGSRRDLLVVKLQTSECEDVSKFCDLVKELRNASCFIYDPIKFRCQLLWEINRIVVIMVAGYSSTFENYRTALLKKNACVLQREKNIF